jgi:carboxyl-terminal processing protease
MAVFNRLNMTQVASRHDTFQSQPDMHQHRKLRIFSARLKKYVLVAGCAILLTEATVDTARAELSWEAISPALAFHRYGNNTEVLATLDSGSIDKEMHLPIASDVPNTFFANLNIDEFKGRRVSISVTLSGPSVTVVSLVPVEKGKTITDFANTSSPTRTAGSITLDTYVPENADGMALVFWGDGKKGDLIFRQLTIKRSPPLSTFAAEDISKDARQYLDHAVKLMKEQALHRKEIDWEHLDRTVAQLSRGAQSVGDTYLVIRYAVTQMRETHTMFLTARTVEKMRQEQRGPDGKNRGASSELLQGKFGYLALPGLYSLSDTEQIDYATSVARQLQTLQQSKPCGWLVDLRNDKGGNMWPMLSGLSPLLGEGRIGSFSAPGEETTIWENNNGQISTTTSGKRQNFNLVAPQFLESIPTSTPVAVLIGPLTGSSGEATTIAFIGRPNTKLFGDNSAGFTTANFPNILSDGAHLLISTSYMTDRTGHQYQQGIKPDVVVKSDATKTEQEHDEVIRSAVDWLETGCTGQAPARGQI